MPVSLSPACRPLSNRLKLKGYVSTVARIAQIIIGAAALAALGVAVWFSIVLARADSYFRQATPASVQRAVEIAPRNTEYLALHALQLDYDGADSTAQTEKIAALNPYSSAPRIKLGLAAEVHGDSPTAEKWLLAAAQVDHQFEPSWTLANFYFRAGKTTGFWTWIHSALEVSYGDRTPAFDLCWRVTSDASEILQRAIPARHEVTAAYLVYLARTNRLAALSAVAQKLAPYHDDADLPLLFGATDQLLAARDPSALDVWKLTGQPVLPSGIFNGDFSSPPLNHGFDWRSLQSAGVTHVHLTAPSGHRIAFNGQQPESCPLLQQTLRLIPGRRYLLRWETRTSGLKSPSGLEWRIAAQHASIPPTDDWTPGELIVTPRDPFNDLQLFYQRPLGEPRAEGNIELRRVHMEAAAP
jgi:tetratricopeptide (TPR) repeat protein